MCEPIVSPGEDWSSLVPDQLLVIDEADPQQAVQNFPGKLGGVPDIGDSRLGTNAHDRHDCAALKELLRIVGKKAYFDSLIFRGEGFGPR